MAVSTPAMPPTAEALASENKRLRARVQDLEQALSDAERMRFFATVIENLNDGVSVVDENGAVKYESPNVGAITGRPSGEVHGETFFQFIHPDDREEIAARFADHLNAPGEWRSATVRIRHADGRYRTIESRAVNLLHVDPIHGLLAIYRDVTDEQESRDRLAEVTASIPGLVFQLQTTRDTHSFEVPFLGDTLGLLGDLADDGTVEDPWALFDRMAREDKPRFFEAVRQAATRADGFAVDFRLCDLHGTERWLRCQASCRSIDDESLLFTCVAYDVSAEKVSRDKMLEAWMEVEARVNSRTVELRKSNERLQDEMRQRERTENDLQAVEHKIDAYERIMTTAELMVGVAHDLHQPLTAIANYAGGCLLRLDRGTMTEEDLVRIFGEIRDSALHAAEIVRHMLEVTRNRGFEREPLAAEDVCRLGIRLARVALHQQSVRLEESYAAGLPDVLADRLPVAQVVLNLLVNASQALGVRPPTDRVVRVATALDDVDGFVRVSVTDNGPGLPKHQHETIFDRFVTSKEAGLGLGLAICRTVVELHDGRIWVESTPGEGSTFQFTLPFAPAG